MSVISLACSQRSRRSLFFYGYGLGPTAVDGSAAFPGWLRARRRLPSSLGGGRQVGFTSGSGDPPR